MLYNLRLLSEYWGPMRMLGSHLVLLGLGTALSAFLVWIYLPRLWHLLPRDRGKALVKEGALSAGKPTGAGCVFFLLTLPVLLLVLPFSVKHWGIVLCIFAAMLTGFLDDRSEIPWGRTRKGILDAAVSIATALFLCGGDSVEIWLPLIKGVFTISPFLYVPVAAFILWFTMNATNCSDGVDGLAGTMTMLSLIELSIFLYGVVGNKVFAQYLLVPHNPDGARWAILCATVSGSTAGYLWYNANPSQVLMGDAGSRALGLLVGVAALATGNPLFVLVIAPVAIVNGGTGLGKIVFLKMMARMGFDTGAQNGVASGKGSHPVWLARQLRRVRFPLHDQCRHEWHWSNAQVLMRFLLLQAGLLPILFLILVKIR